MKKLIAVLLFSVITTAITGCALNPFADDNIYRSQPAEKSSDGTQPKK